ncbi:hypothetical protein HK405_010075, partial [Cladochytrium tenue]
AMQLLLRSIPADKGLYFNIIGFGSTHTLLFPASREYTESSLADAERHVNSIGADMGGTELRSAVDAAFRNRRTDMPTQLFVLTDGEIWDSQSLFAMIDQEVKKAASAGSASRSFVRIFSLGIGSDVSHDLVEGMARHGDGFAQFVASTSERLQPKVIKMLKAAVLPPLKDLAVHWTGNWTPPPEPAASAEPAAAAAISFFSDAKATPKAAAPAPRVWVRQAPFHLPTLWPGARFTVYAVLDAEVPTPSRVKVTAMTGDGPLVLEVDVAGGGAGEETGTTLHVLAARKLIQDLEEARSYLDAEMPAPEAQRRAEVVALGVRHKLVSKYTSFVAVEEKHAKKQQAAEKAEEKKGGDAMAVDGDDLVDYSDDDEDDDDDGGHEWEAVDYAEAPQARAEPAAAPKPGGGVVLPKKRAAPLRLMRAQAPQQQQQQQLQQQQQQQLLSMSSSAYAHAPASESVSRGSAVGSGRGLFGSSFARRSAAPAPVAAAMSFGYAGLPPPPPPAAPFSFGAYSASSPSAPVTLPSASADSRKKSRSPLRRRSSGRSRSGGGGGQGEEKDDADAQLQALTLLQRFDGSFGDTVDGVAGWLGAAPAVLRAGLQAAVAAAGAPSAVGAVSAAALERAYACALAVAGLRARLAGLADEWELVAAKAVRFGTTQLGGASDVWDWLVGVAQGLVAAAA